MTWKERYNRMKSHYGWSDARVAEIIGNSAKSMNVVLNDTKREFPRGLRLAIHIFEMENGFKDEAIVL